MQPRGRSLARHYLLEFACGILALLLVAALACELFGPGPPEAALVASLASLFLVSVLCLSFGPALLDRLKKIGPLELYEEKAQSIAESFNQYHFELKAGSKTGKPWKGLRRVQYEELDQLIFLVELEDQVPGEGALRKSFFKVLFQVGTAAAAQGEWARATRRLERLVELSRGHYEPASVYFNLGVSLLEWAEDSYDEDSDRPEGEPSREELLRKAVANLERACSHDPHDHLGPYWLAFAQDELGQYGDAITANDTAIAIRPQFAPAKYNAAVSEAKLKQYGAAFQRLKSISPEDECGREAFRQALEDQELQPLLDSELGPQVKKYLEGIRKV